MTDKCRAPNLCELAREGIRDFSRFAWLLKLSYFEVGEYD
jgi:hypothetical protein